MQVGEVEQSRDQIDLVARDAEPALEPFQHPARDRARDLDADDVTEAPPAQLVLDRFEQVVGLVGDLEVGVAGDPECAALDDLHAGEQAGQEMPDHTLERDEEPSVTDREEAGQQLRHLHACEALVAGLGVAHEDPEAEGERRDVRERLARHRPRAASGSGRSSRSKRSSSSSSSFLLASSTSPTITPASSRAGRSSRFQSFAWSAVSSSVFCADRGEGLLGRAPVRRPDVQAGFLLAISPATRTWKNSSRLEEK